MNREGSLLLLVDFQERLAASIPDIDSVMGTVKRLNHAAGLLGVAVWATEHCPENIGPTMAELRVDLQDKQILRKRHFSAVAETGFRTRLETSEFRQIIVCGLEAHVCVLQTLLMLSASERDVFLVRDATSSRHAVDRDAAFHRASQAGVRLVTAEMVLFEWMKSAGIPEFREIIALIKSRVQS